MARSIFLAAFVAVAACGHHGNKSDAGGPGSCTQDNQCTVGKCCSNVCVDTTDCAFSVTSIDPPKGFVNGGDYLTLGGAGFDKGMKVFIGDGRAPVRVISPARALVMTPPGPVGVDDVRIEIAGV